MKLIESTLVELAQLFQDLGQAVEAQETPVGRIEHDAEDTAGNVDEGNKQLDVGIKHAESARKLMWWVLLVVVLIICILVLVLGLVFGLRKR